MAKPTLKVIQGQWVANSKWLNFPPTVSARSPFDKHEICAFRVAREDAIKQARVQRRQPVFDLWSCVLGRAPPVPGVVQYNEAAGVDLHSLSLAHACFRGINRPIESDHSGDNCLAYVLKPIWFYEYEPNPVCVAKKSPVPPDLVFVAYVRLDFPVGQFGSLVKGVLTHWQFVEADLSDASLPTEFPTRYKMRIW